MLVTAICESQEVLAHVGREQTTRSQALAMDRRDSGSGCHRRPCSVGRRDQDGASARLAAAVAGQETIIVSTGDVHELVSATGHLVPVAARTLSFDMSGRITKLRVEEGSRVTEGSTICELEAGGADLARSVLSGGYLGSLEQLPSSVAPGVTEQQHGLIKAPFDGVIASVNAGIGSYVSAGQPVATVIDTSSHIAEIEIDEIDLARVKPGMEATISFDAIPGVKLPGKVDYIAAMAVPRGGMVTIPVKVAIEGSHELLKPGLTASVKILSHTLTNVVNIPIRAWIDHEGEPSVVRIEDDIPESSHLSWVCLTANAPMFFQALSRAT